MQVYYQNYWSLHADFVHEFSTLRHKGFSLPLLTTFHRLIRDPEIEAMMKEPSFTARHTQSRIVENGQVQPFFDRYIKRNVPLKRNKKGKIVLFLTLLRFPSTMHVAYLSPEDTLVVASGMPSPKDGPNVIRIEPFIRKGDPEWPAITAKANLLLERHKDHPVFGHPHFREQLFEYMKMAVGAINGVTWLFERHRIATVVLGATNEPIGRALGIMASRRRIPAVATQHGLIGNEWGFFPVYANRLAVFGEQERQLYESRGVPRKQIYITGHPRFDTYRTDPPGDRSELLGKYGVDPARKVVLIITNQIRDKKAWKAYISRLAGYPNVEVLIKPHRNEVAKDMLGVYVNLAKAHPNVKVLADRDVKIRMLLPAVDAAVTELSTAGVEAMVSGTPVLFLRKPDYDNINHRYYYEKMEEFVSTDPVHLAKLTHAVLKQPSVRRRNLERVERFLQHAYPVIVSGEALTRVLSRLTGKVIRRPVARKYEGMLVKGSKPGLFYVRGQVRRRIMTPQALARGGFKPERAKQIPDEELLQIPPGAWLA